jgi:hypothetical protein
VAAIQAKEAAMCRFKFLFALIHFRHLTFLSCDPLTHETQKESAVCLSFGPGLEFTLSAVAEGIQFG